MEKRIRKKINRRGISALLIMLLTISGLPAVSGLMPDALLSLTGGSSITVFAASGDGSGGGGGSSTPLSMNWSYPANGMSDVGIQPVIQCRFTHNVAQSTTFENNQGKFSLQREDGIEIPVIVFAADTQIEFDKRQFLYVTPVEPLDYGTKYTLTLHKGIQAKNGMQTDEDQEINFCTAGDRGTFSAPSVAASAWMEGMQELSENYGGVCTPGIDSAVTGTITDELSGESTDTLPESITVEAGCFGETPEVISSFNYEQLSGLPLVREVYSCASESGKTGVLSVLGVRVTDILSQCGISMSNIDMIRFSSGTGEFQCVENLYDEERYYFPEYEDGLSTLSFSGSQTVNPVRVDGVLTLKDNWGSGSNVPDYFNVSTKGRFRLICGQTAAGSDNLTGSLPWIDTITVQLREPAGESREDGGQENEEVLENSSGDVNDDGDSRDSGTGDDVQTETESVGDGGIGVNISSKSESDRQPVSSSNEMIRSEDQQENRADDPESSSSVLENSDAGNEGDVRVFEIKTQKLPETVPETEYDIRMILILIVLISVCAAAGYYRRRRYRRYRSVVRSFVTDIHKLMRVH